MATQSLLNDSAFRCAEELISRATELGADVHKLPCGGRLVDAGVEAGGSVEAGIELARLCLADRGHIEARPETESPWQTAVVTVGTIEPIAGCLASQYAGWRISVGDYFAMGSGPMRAAYGKEDLFEHIGFTESPNVTVGVLESDALPTSDVFQYVSEKTGVPVPEIVLAVAPTNSLAGGVQVVARSVETALHKLHALEFDLTRIVDGRGTAPLPPVAKKSLEALGRTNDSMLYGAQVTLRVRGDDASLEEMGPRVPSSSSSDHGIPFGKIFARYDYDFYKIDPHLFSPAEVRFVNLDTGSELTFGQVEPSVLAKSFLGS